MYWLMVFLLLVAAVKAGQHDIYSGNRVYGIKLNDLSDNLIITELEQTLGVDVWSHGYPGLRDASIMMTPDTKDEVLKTLDDNKIAYYVEVEDVGKSLETHDEQLRAWRQTQSRNGRLVPFNDYPSHDEVNAYLERVAAAHPDLVTLVNGGPSFEGREIMYVKISTTNFTDTSKPIYFMEAMLHAREWVTTPVTLFSIHRLVEDLRTEDRDLLEDIDWIIIPLVNVDGYEYSRNSERMWRRTRSFDPEVSATCYGVDANRNFDVAWNSIGVSANPCNDQYPGSIPFSELETRMVQNALLEHVERIEIFMDIHSHGNWVLFPFGFNGSVPYNAVDLFQVGSAMGAAIDALKLPEAGFYVVGNSALALYPTSGASDDYALIVGVPLSYCLELPGYGFAFLVPPQYIEQINRETWEGIAISARLARSYYRARQ